MSEEDELARRRQQVQHELAYRKQFEPRIPSQHEYEMRERALFNQQLRDVDKAPLSERKEACASFLDAMKTQPDLIGERIGWLIDGNYGKGSYDYVRQIVLPSKRANRKAQLTHIIGVLEWQCPTRMAAQAWNKLSTAEKKALDKAVQAEIDSYEEQKARGET